MLVRTGLLANRPVSGSKPISVGIRPVFAKQELKRALIVRAAEDADDDNPKFIDADAAKPDADKAAEIAKAALRKDIDDVAGGIIRQAKPAKINPRGPPRDKVDKTKPRPRGYDKTQAATMPILEGMPPRGGPMGGRGGRDGKFNPRGDSRGAPMGGRGGRDGGAGGRGGGNFKGRSGANTRGPNAGGPGSNNTQSKGKPQKKEEGRRMTGSSIRARAERRREERKAVAAGQQKGEKEEIIEVGPAGMPVTELAEKLACTPADIVKVLFMKGKMVNVNQTIDRPTVKLVCEARGVEVWDAEEAAQAKGSSKDAFLDEADLEHLVARPPVVTVMGHVDHGKTSLLDYIRKARVAAGEAGGITQRIGAYNVPVKDLQVSDAVADSICFFDTPGHEAFSAMRARGAMVTDIAIIIVAADDGVRPQTLEAISHAKAAKVPIIVAINKVDKDGANPERVKQQLANDAGLVPEEWGGETPMVPISAKSGQGVNELLENVLLMSELLELQANPNRAARGTVIEAAMDPRRGAVATVLVQAGTLKVGDVVQVGSSYGRIRAMTNDRGATIDQAGPSSAVQMFGLSGVPSAGQIFQVYSSDAEARETAEAEAAKERTARLAEQSSSSLASLSSMDGEDGVQRINLILKADAAGTLEAIKAALGQLPQDKIILRYVLAAPGDVTENDVNLATASQASVVCFNLTPGEAVTAAAKRMGVEIRTYKIIYDLIDDIRAVMEGRLAPIEERTLVGKAEVKAVFGGGPAGKVAGCAVLDGKLNVGNLGLVRRKKKVLHEGNLSSLRRVKDQVKEVEAGKECGVGVDGFKDWEVGDVIEAYEVVRRARTLEEASAGKSVAVEKKGAAMV